METMASVQGFIGVSDHQGRRRSMEDRHTVVPDFYVSHATAGVVHQFAAVYDGHISAEGAELASQRLHELIADQPEVQNCGGMEPVDDEDIQRAMCRAFLEMDQEMMDEADGQGKRYGTTAVCALRIGRLVYVAHAGDSAALLCRKGSLVRLTEDHKPASVLAERTRIESMGGLINYQEDRVLGNPRGNSIPRLNMSRALGDAEFKFPKRIVESVPDIIRVLLQPRLDEFFILASDGVFERMNDAEAVRIVRETIAGREPSDAVAGQAANALVQRAKSLFTSDNMTAIVILFQWPAASC